MNSLTIRPNKGRILLFFAFVSVFACVSLGLIFLPPRETSIIPLNQTLQPIVGVIGFVFALLGYVALFIHVQKPIVRLDNNEIYYPRHQIHILWDDIQKIKLVREWGGHKVRLIYIFAHTPEKFAHVETLEKKYGFIEADITLNFSLATQADFESAYAFMQKYVHQGG